MKVCLTALAALFTGLLLVQAAIIQLELRVQIPRYLNFYHLGLVAGSVLVCGLLVHRLVRWAIFPYTAGFVTHSHQ